MGPLELMECLKERGVKLMLDAGAISYDAPPGAVTRELRAELVKQKGTVAMLLKADGRCLEVIGRIRNLMRAGEPAKARALSETEGIEVLDYLDAVRTGLGLPAYGE